MIRILGIAGSPVKEGNTEVLLREALGAVSADPDVLSQIINLSGSPVSGCVHCNWCLKNQTPDAYCRIQDGMQPIYPALESSDVVVLATPVHIGRMSGLLADMLDRLRVFVYGNVHRDKLKDKVGAALVVAFHRHGGLETTLSVLHNTFALFNMISAGRGGLALTSQEGKGKVRKGIRHMVLEDDLGVSSAREVVQRALEIARILQAGKEALHIRNS